MKVVLFMVFLGCGFAQTPTRVPSGATLPSNCSPTGTNIFLKTGVSAGLYLCLTANIWTLSNASGGGPFLPLTGGTLSGALAGTGATFSGNVVIGATVTLSGLAAAAVPGVLIGNSTLALRTAPVNASPNTFGVASNNQANQLSGGTWSAGIATVTTRFTITQHYAVGDIMTVVGATSSGAGSYNGTFYLTAVTSNTISYAVSTNPGTWTTTPFNALIYLEPSIQVVAKSDFGSSIIAIPNINCVTSGQDVGVPTLGSTGPDGNIRNYGWWVGCDGHSVIIMAGGIFKQFENGITSANTSDHTISWSSSTTANPSVLANIKTMISRQADGVVQFGNSGTPNALGSWLAANGTISGIMKAAVYQSSDGSPGVTGTCAGFPVVKNGLVVSCTGI